MHELELPRFSNSAVARTCEQFEGLLPITVERFVAMTVSPQAQRAYM